MIVYVGNMLSVHGSSINFMELLIPKLRPYVDVQAASRKKNKLVRLLDMLYCIFSNRKKSRLVLIDTYSTQAFWYAILASKLCRLLSINYIPILHGGNLLARYKKDKTKVSRFLNQASSVVSPSIYLHDFFTQEGFKIKTIPNFIDIENYSFLYRRDIGPKLLWVRAFQEIYNPMMAIKVLLIVLLKYPEARLCMVGGFKDNTLEKVNQLIVQNGLKDKVEITGILPKETWIELADQYDVFMNTTNIDNMPISIIEAMALGLPIVSTRVGGIPYLIQDEKDGLLSPVNSPQEMAQSIFRLLESPDLTSRLSINGRSKAEKWSWDVVKYKWYELIENIDQ